MLSGPDGGLAAGDLNGDGNLDAVTDYGWGGSAFLGNGAGGLFPPIPYDSYSPTQAMAVGDFTVDGTPDLVVSGLTVDIRTEVGDGTFDEPIVHSGNGYEHTGVAVADFNGDGKLDAVTRPSSSTSAPRPTRPSPTARGSAPSSTTNRG